MGCHVIPFPAPPEDRCRDLAWRAALAADRVAEQHLAILDSAAQLISLDDRAFAQRLDRMRDAEGGALLGDFLVALQHAAADLDIAGRCIFLTRARLTAGIANLGAPR